MDGSVGRMSKNDRHGWFVSLLGDRLLGHYSDGGAGVTRDKRHAKAAKQSRKRNRKAKR